MLVLVFLCLSMAVSVLCSCVAAVFRIMCIVYVASSSESFYSATVCTSTQFRTAPDIALTLCLSMYFSLFVFPNFTAILVLSNS